MDIFVSCSDCYNKMDLNPSTLLSIQRLDPGLLSHYRLNLTDAISSGDYLLMMESLDAFVLAVTTLCSINSPNRGELSYWHKSVSLAMDHTLALTNTQKDTREILQIYKLVNNILKKLTISRILKLRRAPR